jgi:hypothetical protein
MRHTATEETREGDASKLVSPETGLRNTLEIPRGVGVQARANSILFPFLDRILAGSPFSVFACGVACVRELLHFHE